MSWRDVFKSQGVVIMENMETILPTQEKVSIITEITEGKEFTFSSELDLEFIRAMAGNDWEELKNNPEMLKAKKRDKFKTKDLIVIV